jgi:hypothetical protein
VVVPAGSRLRGGDGYAATFRQYKGNQQTEDEFCRSRSSQACGRIRSQKLQNNRRDYRVALPGFGAGQNQPSLIGTLKSSPVKSSALILPIF